MSQGNLSREWTCPLPKKSDMIHPVPPPQRTSSRPAVVPGGGRDRGGDGISKTRLAVEMMRELRRWRRERQRHARDTGPGGAGTWGLWLMKIGMEI